MVRPAVSVGFKEPAADRMINESRLATVGRQRRRRQRRRRLSLRSNTTKKNSSNRLRSQTFEFFHSNLNAINILPIEGHIWTTNFESTAFTFFHSEQLAKPQNPELLRCSLLLWLNEVE